MIKRSQIIEEARGWIGTPYHHQATLKGVGCDCLGLVRGIYRELVGPEPEQAPPYSSSWAEETGSEIMVDVCRKYLIEVEVEDRGPGDVLLFRMLRNGPIKHMGFLSFNNYIIHAYSGHEVIESPMISSIGSKVTHAFSFPNLEDF